MFYHRKGDFLFAFPTPSIQILLCSSESSNACSLPPVDLRAPYSKYFCRIPFVSSQQPCVKQVQLRSSDWDLLYATPSWNQSRWSMCSCILEQALWLVHLFLPTPSPKVLPIGRPVGRKVLLSAEARITRRSFPAGAFVLTWPHSLGKKHQRNVCKTCLGQICRNKLLRGTNGCTEPRLNVALCPTLSLPKRMKRPATFTSLTFVWCKQESWPSSICCEGLLG